MATEAPPRLTLSLDRIRLLEANIRLLEAKLASQFLELEYLKTKHLTPRRTVYPPGHPRGPKGRAIGTCPTCGRLGVLHALGRCRRCYDRLRKRRAPSAVLVSPPNPIR